MHAHRAANQRHTLVLVNFLEGLSLSRKSGVRLSMHAYKLFAVCVWAGGVNDSLLQG